MTEIESTWQQEVVKLDQEFQMQFTILHHALVEDCKFRFRISIFNYDKAFRKWFAIQIKESGLYPWWLESHVGILEWARKDRLSYLATFWQTKKLDPHLKDFFWEWTGGLKLDNCLGKLRRTRYFYSNGHSTRDYADLTPEMICQAREKSFLEVLDVKRSPIKCPFHEEKHGSFSIKHNRGYCFGACGWRGDVIDFVMDKYTMTFPDAVKFLMAK